MGDITLISFREASNKTRQMDKVFWVPSDQKTSKDDSFIHKLGGKELAGSIGVDPPKYILLL